VALLSRQTSIWRERPPSPDWAWQKPTGAQFEFLPN